MGVGELRHTQEGKESQEEGDFVFHKQFPNKTLPTRVQRHMTGPKLELKYLEDPGKYLRCYCQVKL